MTVEVLPAPTHTLPGRAKPVGLGARRVVFAVQVVGRVPESLPVGRPPRPVGEDNDATTLVAPPTSEPVGREVPMGPPLPPKGVRDTRPSRVSLRGRRGTGFQVGPGLLGPVGSRVTVAVAVVVGGLGWSAEGPPGGSARIAVLLPAVVVVVREVTVRPRRPVVFVERPVPLSVGDAYGEGPRPALGQEALEGRRAPVPAVVRGAPLLGPGVAALERGVEAPERVPAGQVLEAALV